MPNDAVKIPQNVQIEDKVVGPLSLRQIIIIAIGGGFSYMIYSMVQRSMGHVSIPLTVVIWIPALLAAAFALVNINDLSLLRICFLLLERTQKPGRRIWAPRTGITLTIRTSTFKDEKAPEKTVVDPALPNTSEQISALSSVADTGNPLPAITETPATDVQAADSSAETKNAEDVPPAWKPPVNPGRIQVDAKSPTQSEFSDLSVFRDIFPPNTTWPA